MINLFEGSRERKATQQKTAIIKWWIDAEDSSTSYSGNSHSINYAYSDCKGSENVELASEVCR